MLQSACLKSNPAKETAMKLYIYDHCPFCVRARMIFGLRNVPVEEIVLLNDDEATAIGLIGTKCPSCKSRTAATWARASISCAI